MDDLFSAPLINSYLIAKSLSTTQFFPTLIKTLYYNTQQSYTVLVLGDIKNY